VVVVGGVPLALGGASVAGDGAQAAELRSERPAARHDPDGGGASLRTVAVEANAHGEHGGVALIEARIRAHLAGNEAFDAGFETCVIRGALAAQVRAEVDGWHHHSVKKGGKKPPAGA
jgi:hypothetical protein